MKNTEPKPIPLSDLRPSLNNPRIITPEAINMVGESLREFGWQQPIVATHDGEIVAGHTRYQAALQIHAAGQTIPGWEDTSTAWAGLLPADTPAQKIQAFKVADNRTGMESKFDTSLLSNLMREFNLDKVFTGLNNSETSLLAQNSVNLSDLNKVVGKGNGSKSPITYYGGKKKLAPVIAELILSQDFKNYIEPFAGGAAIAFTPVTQDRKHVCINDTNLRMINFWEHCADPDKLAALVALCEQRGIVHQEYHRQANNIYHGREEASAVENAWAVWYSAKQSIMGMVGHNFGIHGGNAGMENGIRRLASTFREQMRQWVFTTKDAVELIGSMARPETMIYADPPYIAESERDVDQGHYKGYTEQDFSNLLDALAAVSGKFVLSTYENNLIKYAISKHGWNLLAVSTKSSASNGGRTPQKGRSNVQTIMPGDKNIASMRVEWLVCNYPIPAKFTDPTAAADPGGATPPSE